MLSEMPERKEVTQAERKTVAKVNSEIITTSEVGTMKTVPIHVLVCYFTIAHVCRPRNPRERFL